MIQSKINLRLNFAILRIMFLDRSENYLRLFFDILSMCFRFFLLIGIYYYLFEYKGQVINGLTLQIVAWSFFFYFTFMMINFRYLSRTIMQEVKSGKIEILFSKPVNYLSFKFFESLGNKLLPFTINFVVLFVLLAYALGVPDSMQNWFFLLSFPLTFLFCLVLNFLIYAILGVFSFWMDDVTSLLWVVDKFVMILGGSFLPVAFFPEFMKNLAIYSPFGATMFVTHTVYSTWITDFFKHISVQVFWIFVLFVVLYFLYRKALSTVSVNGG